ncbi:hypothetical protein ACJX0J_020638, partial [Zea mays]
MPPGRMDGARTRKDLGGWDYLSRISCKDPFVICPNRQVIHGQFAIDTKNKDVKYACADLMRCNQRQMRYKLKKAYFNGVAADKVRTTSPLSTMTDEQWMQLVNMWSTPKNKDKCVDNKVIRGKDTIEALVAEPGVEGKESKTPTEAVAQVLSSSKFLHNIGLVPATKKSCNGGDPTRATELEAEHESEKQNSLA